MPARAAHAPSSESEPLPRAVWALAGAGAVLGLASAAAASSSALATYFARRIVTPERVKTEDQEVLAVQGEGSARRVILRATPETRADGEYSLFFDGGAGHVRLGAPIDYAPEEPTVTRPVLAEYSGDLTTAVRARWSGYVYGSPADLGLAYEDVVLPLDVGPGPAWYVPAPGATWAIMVHGRGATRGEGLRALPTAQALGMPSLLVSYRNDGEASATPDGRYGLGMTEWRDVEIAIQYALDAGARDVVLFGWSMGGAISLLTADSSLLREHVRALVLDAPVVDWVDVLAYQARLNRIPSRVGRLGQLLLGRSWGRRLTGLAAPLDFKAMDWVTRAVELRTPTLILHSVDDDFVPVGPSLELAKRNPEMVTLETFRHARHTKEWNVDPERWESVVRSWLSDVLAPRRAPGGAA
ncbi:pimeloyl-ACP methyl ester carboxylesterase [Sinomonas atrocyanea]|uniref:alpha/beta hydrolase family protein n=1 Tax=Sinomonas atrocyanea TaxID=37927 RepID=UPI002784DA7F|nr:alpha/beta fold hydrolase [Sinomonas atrocyanea]MDP9885083.1 pimeloyl-ACP methyl ester carboxylesterase [Sinomonas atrocyanea]